MTDGKEVKRFNSENSGYGGDAMSESSDGAYMYVSDHDRIVAELKTYASELELKIADLVLFPDQESSLKTIAELRAEVEKLERALEIASNSPEDRSQEAAHYNWLDDQMEKRETTIATQARVIDIAKRVLHNAGLRPPDGGTPTVETICEDLNDAIKEIAAIEKEGAKDG